MIDDVNNCHVVHKKRTVFPCQAGPQMVAAITTGTISFTVIWLSMIDPAHFSMNQLVPE